MNLIHRVEELSMYYVSGSRRAIGAFILRERRHLHNYSINLEYKIENGMLLEVPRWIDLTEKEQKAQRQTP